MLVELTPLFARTRRTKQLVPIFRVHTSDILTVILAELAREKVSAALWLESSIPSWLLQATMQEVSRLPQPIALMSEGHVLPHMTAVRALHAASAGTSEHQVVRVAGVATSPTLVRERVLAAHVPVSAVVVPLPPFGGRLPAPSLLKNLQVLHETSRVPLIAQHVEPTARLGALLQRSGVGGVVIDEELLWALTAGWRAALRNRELAPLLAWQKANEGVRQVVRTQLRFPLRPFSYA